MSDVAASSDDRGTAGMKTRASLLLRLRDLGNQESWQEFVELYGPFILRCVRSMGLREEDARDVVQDVMRILVHRIGKFEYDSGRSFRAYLLTIARNKVRRFLNQNRRRPRAHGGTTHRLALQDAPGAGPPEEAMIQLEEQTVEKEWQRRRLEVALKRLREEDKNIHEKNKKKSEKTWQIVELSFVEHLTPGEIARRLDVSPGSVYTALSRFRERVRQELEKIDE